MWLTLEALRLHLYKRGSKEHRGIQGSNCSLRFALHQLPLDHDTDATHYHPHFRHLPMGERGLLHHLQTLEQTAQYGKLDLRL